MTASRAPLATKKTQKNKDNELVVSHLWSLWHSLQELAENQSKKIPTKSIQNNNCFEWCDPTKGLSTQVLVLATIDRMLAREGYKRATFDISNLNHQYQHAKKKLCVDIAVTRLGVMAYAQAL